MPSQEAVVRSSSVAKSNFTFISQPALQPHNLPSKTYGLQGQLSKTELAITYARPNYITSGVFFFFSIIDSHYATIGWQRECIAGRNRTVFPITRVYSLFSFHPLSPVSNTRSLPHSLLRFYHLASMDSSRSQVNI